MSMRLQDTLSLSARMFKNRPLRTFLTILGVSVGIGAVLFLVSLGYGIQNAILSQITTVDSLLSLDVSSGSTNLIKITKKDLEEIALIPQVTEVSPVVDFSAQLTMGEFTSDGIIYAVTPSFFRLDGIILSEGQFFEKENEKSIIISSAGAQLFNSTPEEILGKEIDLTIFVLSEDKDGFDKTDIYERESPYKVVGVIESQDTNFAYIPEKTISDIEIKDYALLKVKVADNEVMEIVRDIIIERGFIVSSLSDTIEQANQIFKVVQIILALFGLIALLVSAIGMFNTMTIALLERTNEVGIMRAVGITQKGIVQIFIYESVLMGFLGGIGGLIVGYVGGELTNFGINILAKTFGGKALDLFYQPFWFIMFILVFSTVTGFLTGVYPSIKASRLNPLTALKYK